MCTQTRRNGELLYIEYDIVDFKKIRKKLHVYSAYTKLL